MVGAAGVLANGARAAALAGGARPTGTGAKGKGHPGNTVELMDLDDMEKARRGSDEGVGQALPEDEAAAEDDGAVAVADAGVRGAVNALQAIARARGGGGQENIDRETRKVLGELAPGKAAAAGDEGPVDVKMPPGGMSAWIARNQHKKVRVGDKETLAILADVRGGAAPASAPGAAPPAAHAAAVEGRSDPGANVAPVAPAPAAQRTIPASADASAGAPAPVAQAKAASPVARAGTDAAPAKALAAAENPFDLEAAGQAALRALLDVPAAPRAPAPGAKEPPVATVPLDVAGVRASFAPLVSDGALEVAEHGRAPALRLPAKTMFSSDASTGVRTQGRELLRRVATLLERWPDSRLEIVGPMEPAAGATAWSRSAARAVEVARVLAASGVAPGRIATLVVGGASAPGEPAVEIVLLPATAPASGAR
jgi:flagellar motor protein MotB